MAMRSPRATPAVMASATRRPFGQGVAEHQEDRWAGDKDEKCGGKHEGEPGFGGDCLVLVPSDAGGGFVGEGGEAFAGLKLGVDHACDHGFGVGAVHGGHVLDVAYGRADSEV